MAHSKRLNPKGKEVLASRLGELLVRHELVSKAGATLELGESFQIYILSADDIAAASKTGVGLSKVLHRTPQWHHQIVADQEMLGFARATEPIEDGGDWSIHGVFKSDLAMKIGKATHRIDKERPEHDTEVKLFVAPDYHLYAFLLENPSGVHVLVIDSPNKELNHSRGFLTEAEFLKKIAAEPRIRGLVPGSLHGIIITPQNATVSEGRSITLHSHDERGTKVAALWTITPGTIGTSSPIGMASETFTYTAPQEIVTSQGLRITASGSGASAQAVLFLAPHSVQIIPTSVELKLNQSQQFTAVVSDDSDNKVKWVLSPGVGNITDDGLYTPDQSLVEATTVNVMAITAFGSKVAAATVKILPPPWTGWKRNLIGFYLLGVFSLVFLLIPLWPPPAAPPKLSGNLQTAQNALSADNQNLARAEVAVASGSGLPKDALARLQDTVSQLQQRVAQDQKTLSDAKISESASMSSNVALNQSSPEGRLGTTLPRDVDLLFLVLIGGALGAFLHATRSFTVFVGNLDMKSSWAWWYYLHPFLGAILALAFYLAVRGGFLAITNGATTAVGDLSPFAITSVSVLVGMFSKNAITKLGEVFETLFQPRNPGNMKNPLGSPAQTQVGAGTALKVASIAPASGPASGGTVVTITGTGFSSGTTVTIGGNAVTAARLVSPTAISGMAPTHAPGYADVEVTNADGQKSVVSNGFVYV